MKTAYHYTSLLALFLMLVFMTATEVQSLPSSRAESSTAFLDAPKGRPAGACCDIGKASAARVLVALNAVEASQRVKSALEVLV